MSTFMNQILRSSTFRASASSPSVITWSLAYPRQFTTQQKESIKSALEARTRAIKPALEARIRAVNAKPSLTQSEKYHTSKYLFALIDGLAAKQEVRARRSRMGPVLKCAISGTTYSPYISLKQSQLDGQAAAAIRELLSLQRKVLSQNWETFKLSMLAPLSEVGLAARMSLVILVIWQRAIGIPCARFHLFLYVWPEKLSKKYL